MLLSAKIPFWFCALLAGLSPGQAGDEDVAIAIVYDTSGSMAEPVKGRGASKEPKFRIGNRALEAIVARLEEFQKTGARPLQVGLFTFTAQGATPAVPIGAFEPKALRTWLGGFAKPEGGTPLGSAIRDATNALWKTKAGSRHVLAITDGENTVGPAPEAFIPNLQNECLKNGLSVYFHFVAFDVDARAYAGVKKFGSTLLGATNEVELNKQLGLVLEEKILLEKE